MHIPGSGSTKRAEAQTYHGIPGCANLESPKFWLTGVPAAWGQGAAEGAQEQVSEVGACPRPLHPPGSICSA